MDKFKTLEELVAEVDKIVNDDSSYKASEWLSSNGFYHLIDEERSNLQDINVAVKHLVRIAYDAAAGDHKAWYLPDKNGEKVRIGDMVKTRVGECRVVGFRKFASEIMAFEFEGGCNYHYYCEKIEKKYEISNEFNKEIARLLHEHMRQIDDSKRYEKFK